MEYKVLRNADGLGIWVYTRVPFPEVEKDFYHGLCIPNVRALRALGFLMDEVFDDLAWQETADDTYKLPKRLDKLSVSF